MPRVVRLAYGVCGFAVYVYVKLLYMLLFMSIRMVMITVITVTNTYQWSIADTVAFIAQWPLRRSRHSRNVSLNKAMARILV